MKDITDVPAKTAVEAAAVLHDAFGFRPKVAVVLGSGLGGLVEALEDRRAVPFSQLPGFADTGVVGHAGEFVAGRLAGVPVVLQAGRCHIYEGHPRTAVAAPVRTLAEIGIEALVVTNAAGGITEALDPGEIMLITDHINLMGTNPLIGAPLPGESRFTDMTVVYDAGMRKLALATAEAAGIELHQGIYAAVHGPSFETPAEIRMLGLLGADAVGMSTVPEVSVARARDVRCLGFSAITNRAAGLGKGALDHAEVLALADVFHDRLATIVGGVLEGLDSGSSGVRS